MFDNPEEGLIKSHQPCPCGNSSDAFAYYKNGGHCFSGKCENGKNKFTNAHIKNSSIIADSKWNFWSNPKVVIAGMTKVR